MPSSVIADMSFAIQSAKGVVPSAAFRVYLAGGSPLQANGGVSYNNSTASGRMPLSAYMDPVRASGEPVIFARPDAIGALVYAVLGVKAVAGIADPWTHTLTPGNTQPWLTFWRGLGGIVNERFDDCKLTSLKLTSQAGRPVTVTFGVVGITSRYRSAAETSITPEIAPTFLHYHGAGQLQIEGVAVTAIDEWELTLDPGTTVRDSLAGTDVRTGPRLVTTVTASQVVANANAWNRFRYTQTAPADLTAAGPVTTELPGPPAGLTFKLTAQSSPERSLQIDVPRVVLANVEGFSHDPNGRPLRQTVTYTALKPAAGAGVTLTVKNGRSSY